MDFHERLKASSKFTGVDTGADQNHTRFLSNFACTLLLIIQIQFKESVSCHGMQNVLDTGGNGNRETSLESPMRCEGSV